MELWIKIAVMELGYADVEYNPSHPMASEAQLFSMQLVSADHRKVNVKYFIISHRCIIVGIQSAGQING